METPKIVTVDKREDFVAVCRIVGVHIQNDFNTVENAVIRRITRLNAKLCLVRMKAEATAETVSIILIGVVDLEPDFAEKRHFQIIAGADCAGHYRCIRQGRHKCGATQQCCTLHWEFPLNWTWNAEHLIRLPINTVNAK